MGKKRIPLSSLGVAALCQLQSEGVNVTKELTEKGRPDLVNYTPHKEEKTNKYHVAAAEDRTYDGITFDSKSEMSSYQLLRKYNIDFEYHPIYELQPEFVAPDGKKIRPISYEGDFLIKRPEGNLLVDTKGMETDIFKMKRKMLLYKHGVVIHCMRSLKLLTLFLFENKLLKPETVRSY
jgi:hypothetical protein